ncbi:uncharacterized protein ATC70_003614 [Mucor velutinosus]|uniref:Reverse transcriptase n=1 Tax=Mucor velutinosus TaxID=708070 RepID=A0AAN7D9A1_9FUNG|nr:hypothetical protein ATC70_003614 [Mucor velutinosus]
MSAQSTTTSPSSESKPAGNTELRPSDASATKAVDITGPSQFFLAETSQKLGGQAGEAPTTTASDAMDLDPPSSASSSSSDVDLQGRTDQLKLIVDNQLAEVQLLSTTLLLEQSEEARAQALARLIQLNTSIQSIIQIRDCLLASKATANDNLVSSAAASFGPSSVDGVKSNKSASVPVFFPNNLPAFQWVGMDEFDPKSPIFPTVDACLLKFEDVMFAYKMDFDKEYARLVPPMLSPEQRTWYGSFTSACTAPASWNDFKSAIKARYGISVLEERQRCASDLLSIQLLPGENVKAFLDRFTDLRRRSLDQAPSDYLLAKLFLDAIPWVVKDKINTIRQSKGIIDSYDVDIIVSIARESLSTMTANEIAAISAPAFARTAAGSAASQWAPVASPRRSHTMKASSSSTDGPAAVSRAGVSSGRVGKPHFKATKSCTFHHGKPHNHDTSECKLFLEELKNKGGANSMPTSNQASGRRYMMSLADAKASDRCRTCGAHNYSAGPHECNTAVRTGDAPTSTLHRFGMLRLQEGVVSSATTAGSTAIATAPAVDPTVGSLSEAGAAKFCRYHPNSKTHSTDDCVELLQVIKKNPPRSQSRLAVETNGGRSAALLSSSVSSPQAQPTTGNSVVVQEDQQSNNNSSESGSSLLVPAAVAKQSRHDQSDCHSAVEPMDIDLHTAVHAHKCKDNQRSILPVNKSNSLLIPLVVESHKVYGVLDTGCTFSICSPRFANQLGVQINRSVHGQVQLGHTDSVKPRIGTCSLKISYNKRSFIHTFEIFDFFTDSDDCPMLLGLDIMPDLQIGITGLASTWFEELGPRLPDPIDPDIEPNNDPYGSPAERAKAFKPIEQLLVENAAIDLATTHCNLPGAIVQLETIPGKVAYRAPYPIPVVYKEAVSKQLMEWERDGVIERSPSHNGWNSPLLVVAKKNSNGEYSFDKPRIVADVRLLNQILVSTDKYIMPRIDEIHARHSRAVMTSSIDIKSFFTSFLVDPRHRHKLTFTDPFTQTQWVHRKVCFGVNFMGNLAMRLISNLFTDMLDQVSLYIDDLGCLTYTDSLDEHVALVAEVIRRLTKANLQINQDKFVFAQRSTHVLGWSIIQNRLVPDARKLTNFHLWPIPTTGKQLMKYLGFCNYFRNVIPGYSELAAPLDALRNCKSLSGLWTDAHTKAFKSLQNALSSPVALSPVDFRYKLHVATDASATAIGGIIYYIKDGVVHYVVMASRKLSPSEMAYSTTKRELLAIVYMLTKYHKWLFGIEFVLHTDHRSLIWLQTQSTPNMMLLTWYEKLFFDYKYELVHIPGTRNLLPDALSRLFTSDDDEGGNNLGGGNRYNNQSIMLPEKKRKPTRKNKHGFTNAKESQVTQFSLAKPNHSNRTQFKRKKQFNNRKQLQQLSFGMPTELDPHYYSKELNDSNVDIFDASTYNMPSVSAQDLKNQLIADAKSSYNGSSGGQSDCNALISRAMKYADYMTPPKKDRLELVMRVHLLGHVGINSMEKILHNDYKVHWTNMRNDIATVTKDCHACQSHGIYQVGYHPPRSVLPDNVFDHIAIDLGDFATTSTSGNNFLLVIVDYFSRFTILRALPDKSPITVARALLSVCCLFGFPKRLTSDNGSEFVGAFMREFSQISGMDRLTSLPYAAQANGVVEAYVGISKRSIIKSLTHDAAEPEAWDEYLDVIQYAMNIQYARLHQSQPFAIMFGRAPNLFQDYTQLPNADQTPEDPTKEVIDARLQNIKDVVIPAIHKRIKETQLRDHERFEKHHKIIEEKYPINSKVMLFDPVRSTKLHPRWLGPYFIKNYTRNGSYTLADITGELLPRDVPTQHIRVVDFSDNHVTKGLLPRHYEVQAIVNHRVERKTGRMKFLVNWVGYPSSKDNTWQYESDFDSKRPIRDYWDRIAPDHKNPNRLLPNTVNKRKIYSRRKHAGPSVTLRYPSIPNSRNHNIQQ